MKTSKYKFIPPLIMLIFLVSCLPPKNKEAYILGFEKFVDRVEENHKNYNKKDWEWADSQFNKYSAEWYTKFKGEYTIDDQIKIKTFILKYNSFRNNEDIGKILKDLFKEDVEKMKGKVEEYIDKDMEEDLEKLIDGATEIGDSAIKVLEEIIEKIDNTF